MAAIISFNIQALFMLLFGEVILLFSIVSLISLFAEAEAIESGYSVRGGGKNAIMTCDILAYSLICVFHASTGRECYLQNNCR